MTSISTIATAVRSRPRLAGYYVVTSLVTAVFTGLWLFEGYFLFTAWFPSFDELTPINGVAAGGFMTLMLVCSVAALLRPTRAIGPSKVLVAGTSLLGLLMPLAFVVDTPLVTALLLSVSVSILALLVWLHPARSELLEVRHPDPNYPLLGLAVVIAVPFLWLAVEFQWLQITRDDEVAGRWFYGGLSMYLLAIVVLSALASIDAASRRLFVSSAVFLAGLLGLVSVVYPSELHSFGTLGGGLVLAWCVAIGLAWLSSSGRL